MCWCYFSKYLHGKDVNFNVTVLKDHMALELSNILKKKQAEFEIAVWIWQELSIHTLGVVKDLWSTSKGANSIQSHEL